MLDARKDIIDFFEKGIFSYKGNVFKTKKEKLEKESEENKFFKYIENETKSINYELFEKDFSFAVPSALAKQLFETKDKKKNSEFLELIKVRCSNLKDEIKKVPEDEKKIEQPDKILKIVEEILNFNKKFKKQSGQGLKILTSDQMLRGYQLL